MPPINWTAVITQVFITVLATVGSLLLYHWKRGDRAKRDQDRRHSENQQAIAAVSGKVTELATSEQFMPQHFHQEFYTETDGDEPLRVNGIIRKPNGAAKH